MRISRAFKQRAFLTLFIIKPTRCSNFTNLFCHETLHVSDSSSVHHLGVYSLYTQQWYMSYSFRAGPGWNCRSIRVLLERCRQTTMTYTVASAQWMNSWWWTDELSETCRVSWQNKFVKLVHLVGFITKKFVTTHVTSHERKIQCESFHSEGSKFI
jgi:hypothetical protein